jgi:hypothetical protein
MRKITKVIAATAAIFIAAIASSASFAASAFEGTWKVKDTAGKEFEITLAADGKATATRGEGMTGTWKDDAGTAVITWNTGWVTKISKEGEKYTKTAFKKGEAEGGKPANSSAAEKVK